MKKLIIAIILTCCFSASLSAQQRSRHETTLGYGMGTTSELLLYGLFGTGVTISITIHYSTLVFLLIYF